MFGMIQLRDRLDLALESPGERVAIVGLALQDLEGDGPLHPPVSGLEDGPHARPRRSSRARCSCRGTTRRTARADGVGLEAGEVAGVDEAIGEVVSGIGIGLVKDRA